MTNEELWNEWTTGWHERREYVRHGTEFVDHVWQESLLSQLRNHSGEIKSPGSDSGGGGKPKTRPPGDLDAFDTYILATRALRERAYGKLRELRRLARIMLSYDVPEMILPAMQCHVCGGALAVPEDASGDVRCIGNEEPCPESVTYARESWLDLFHGMQPGQHGS